MAQWTPRGADPVAHHALVDGIPPWIHGLLREWFVGQFTTYANGFARRWGERMQAYDMAARSAWAEDLMSYGPTAVFDSITPDEALRMLDWLVYDNATNQTRDDNPELEEVLRGGGSMWKVGERDGVPGLERRVPEGVQEAAEAAMAAPGNAGSLLSEAWHAVFGMNPDYEKAYAKSIKAVEAAAIPVVSPTNRAATLGTVIQQLRDQGDWKLNLAREHATHTTQQVILGMAQALWTGQNDRHAGQPGYTPSTQAEAEAAVMLAVPLVQLFSSGAIARR